MLTIVFPPRHRLLALRLLLALITVVVAGCEAPPVKPQGGEYTTQESRIQQAEYYLTQSRAVESPEKDILRLQAAELFAKSSLPGKAFNAIRGIRPESLPDGELGRYGLLASSLALERKDTDFAESVLNLKQLQTLSTRFEPTQREQWFVLNAELQEATGNNHKSLYFYTRAALLTKNAGKRTQIHNKIWHNLNRQSKEELQQNNLLSNDAVVISWYELAMATRSTQGDLTRQIEAIEQWQKRNSGHPAARDLPDSLKAVVTIDRNTPVKIALMLPTADNYKLAAKTVMEGVMAAYYRALNNGSDVPEITLYDTDSGDIASLYQQAVSEGAQLIIGPLRKEKLEALMSTAELPVPVLALNVIDDKQNPHNALFQFGLSVENEALQVAQYGWQTGYRAALIITPDTRWGQKAKEVFTSYWLEQGGRIAASPVYSAQQMDYAELLEPAFLLHHSSQRAQRLRQTLGKSIAFNPSRRRDLDMIFMLANAQTGQQIKPSLDFLYASDLPVFATSMINDGKANKSVNSDLNDILFPAMPWSVEAFSRSNLKPVKPLPGAYRNLFALGADAYGIHQWLSVLQTMPGVDIRGQTGELSMTENNQIVRKLPWAKFIDGKAEPMPTTGDTN